MDDHDVPDATKAFAEAERRIQECKATNASELDLSSLGLETLPDSLGSLTALQELNLVGNQLTSLPDSLGSLTSLQRLSLDGNQLTSLPDSLGSLTSLQALCLSENQLTSLPDSVGALSSLQALYLDGNQLTSLPGSLGLLTALQQLNLNGNQLAFLPDSVGALSSLQALYLDENQLTSLPDSLRSLKLLQRIDIDGNQFTSFPEILYSLTSLQVLYFNRNRLKSLSESLCLLTSLQGLYLAGNQLTSLPDSLGEMVSLQTLNINRNQLTSLPDSLGEMVSLQTLNINRNQLTSLPDSLGSLTSLHKLYLDENQLISLPESLGLLTSLQELNLSGNRLTSLPDSIRNLAEDVILFVHGNPALNISTSVLGPAYYDWFIQGRDKNSAPRLGPIVDYYFRIHSDAGVKPLDEAKLILVGRGEVGKTSLVKRLVDNKFLEGEDPTHGILIRQWSLKVVRNRDVNLHVWDFGGQEIMHATHQFFLTDRSLYLLVLDGRAGQQELEADYWLRLITSFAPESPVIVVLNKIQAIPFDLNRSALQEKYPQIKAFVETDCKNKARNNRPGKKGCGIDELREAIVSEIETLPDVDIPFPNAWFAVKEKLSDTRFKKRNFISLEDYRELCIELGEADSGAQSSLAVHLHRLGIALNFGDDPRLRHNHILNPHWVTEGIYTLLNSVRLAKQKGEFTVKDLRKELDARDYPSDKHQFLIDLMQKFELCFSFEDGSNYLIPELLDLQQPSEAKEFDQNSCLNFQYHYPILPSGILPRFIVRTHVLSEEYRWRTGVILEFEGNRALVKADPQERKVYISISGPTAEGRRRTLAVIREDFETIHRDIKHLNAKEMVPLPGVANAEPFPYSDLEVFEKDDPESIVPINIDGKVQKFRVRDLLSGVDLITRTSQRKTISLRKRPLVFYSYSHVNSRHRKQLDKHLAPLRRMNLIEDWCDHEIFPGDEWSDEINQKLQSAQIILLLISADFINSGYCYEIETEEALKLHENGSAIVIPIIVSHVNGWSRLPIGKLNALPPFGKPISDWDPRDSGWTEVAAGIERVARKFLDGEKL